VVVLPVGCEGGVGGVTGAPGKTGSVLFVAGGAGIVLFPRGVSTGPVGVVAFLVELIGCVTFV
jgi:hypothetical protein